MAAAVVHNKEEIIIRHNDSASAEMTAIRVALEKVSETRDTITIHTDSLTAVNILNNRKLDLNTITRAIRDAASRLTLRPTINWIPTHTGILGNQNVDQAAKRGLQLDIIHTTVNTSTFREQTKMKEQIARHYNEQAYNDASLQTKDHRQLHQTDSSRMKLMSIPRTLTIRSELGLPGLYKCGSMTTSFSGTPLTNFMDATEIEIRNIIKLSPAKSCELDPLPTWLLKECIAELVPTITDIVNMS